MKRTTFTAKFSDGVELKRTSDRKTYTHAWRVVYTVGPIPHDWDESTRDYWEKAFPTGSVQAIEGFASTDALAAAAMQTAVNQLAPKKRDYRGSPRIHTAQTAEIVPVVVS